MRLARCWAQELRNVGSRQRIPQRRRNRGGHAVIRLSQRLGLTKHKDPEKIERDLMKLVPREHWTDWSHWLIWHGRRRCFARKPDCSNCEGFSALSEW